jgi:anti-sigma regulatory factor (Ser/Thr protein kinase)
MLRQSHFSFTAGASSVTGPARREEASRGWVLPHTAKAPLAARRLTRAVLGRCGLAEEDIDNALLIVSELVTNAVEHALPPVTLRVQHQVADGMVRVEVTDGGPARLGERGADRVPEEHGRGSTIVACLATAHGTLNQPEGVTRWADLRCTALSNVTGQAAPGSERLQVSAALTRAAGRRSSTSISLPQSPRGMTSQPAPPRLPSQVSHPLRGMFFAARK